MKKNNRYFNDLEQAIKDDDLPLVKRLLENELLGLSPWRSEALSIACRNGKVEIVKYLLYDLKVDPSFKDNFCLIEAVFEGYYEIVELLLKHPKVNPAALNNAPITNAVMYCRGEIIELLLRDPRVDPAQSTRCLVHAVENAWKNPARGLNTLKLLLRDGRVFRFDFQDLYNTGVIKRKSYLFLMEMLEDLIKQKAATGFCCKMIGDVWPDLAYLIVSRMDF